MDFVANKKPQIKEMLAYLGLNRIEELFADIPHELLLPPPTSDDGLSEFEGLRELEKIADKNRFHRFESYLGGGAYEHHIPSIASAICQKSEFLTAYTPYQAEISQGTLQAIFEFQSAICALTGLDVSNASVYDGASACAEAVLMALRAKPGRNKILISDSLNPMYRAVIDLYTENKGVDIVTFRGPVDSRYFDEDIAAVLVQSPNFFGSIEEIEKIFSLGSGVGALNILCADPLSFGLYKSASELGADIAVGDCQPLGIPLQYGGPYAGYMACRKELMRLLPGRIVGETRDISGKRGFVLTLQVREQHIRREKSTSNICTNQALCALSSVVTMFWYGPEGIKQLALTNFQKSSYLKNALKNIPGIVLVNKEETFNEFVIRCSVPLKDVFAYFRERNIEPGINLHQYFPEYENCLLIAATETKNKEQLDRYIAIMKEIFIGK